MSFLVFTYVGLAVGLAHVWLPGPHRVGAAGALALGMAGAWAGALLAGAFVQGGWAFFGPLALAGSILGAGGAVVSVELFAERVMEEEERRL